MQCTITIKISFFLLSKKNGIQTTKGLQNYNFSCLLFVIFNYKEMCRDSVITCIIFTDPYDLYSFVSIKCELSVVP